MLLEMQSFLSFDAAVHAVLRYLHKRIGFDLWMVTRLEGDELIVLQEEGEHYTIKRGDKFDWGGSLCHRMAHDLAPRVAPCVQDVPVYASTPNARQFGIGAYIGVPLTHEGRLFGVLCGLDSTPQPAAIVDELPLVELMAMLLNTILKTELAASEQTRRAERARIESMQDGLTGLYNRKGWNCLVELEETRCQQLGFPACVISIDLNGLKQINDTQGHSKGDELIQRAGQVLHNTVRQQDVVARLGGDEFAILCVECVQDAAKLMLARIQLAMQEAGISASLGLAARQPHLTLLNAYQQADERMYEHKRGCRRSL